jgi:hypothetical protein
MTFDGSHYMHPHIFLNTCIRLIENTNVTLKSVQAYTFDEIDGTAALKPIALKMYRVFDNNTMLVIADLEFYNINVLRSNTKQFQFVVERSKSGAPQIKAVYGFTDQPEVAANYKLNTIAINQLKIRVSLPKDFSNMQIDRRLINYFNAERSAVFQIFAVRSNDLKGEAMNYMKQIVHRRDFHDLSIRFIPNGYNFKFYIKDSANNIQIVKISAVKAKNKIVFVSLFAPKSLYSTRRFEFNYCLDSVVVLRN